jgi:hypothetical protein
MLDLEQLESARFPKNNPAQKIVKPYERSVFFNDYFYILHEKL